MSDETRKLFDEYNIFIGGYYEVEFNSVTPMMMEFGYSTEWVEAIKSLNGMTIRVTSTGERNEMPYVVCRAISKIIPIDCLAVYADRNKLEPDEGVEFF